MSTFHVHKFDYTNWSTDRRAAFKYKIFTDNDAMNTWDAMYRVETLGAFDTLETAVRAIEADAGEIGVTRWESTYDEVDEQDVVVAAFNLGSNGLLAARGTREEYAEWAYETVHEEGARDFAEQARRVVRAAVEEEMPIPDVDTLIEMMEAYLARGPYKDYPKE